jgi:hypothetical protein
MCLNGRDWNAGMMQGTMSGLRKQLTTVSALARISLRTGETYPRVEVLVLRLEAGYWAWKASTETRVPLIPEEEGAP